MEKIPTVIFQRGLTGWEWQLRRYVSTPIGEDDLAASAIVFAPHPDDETLACAGIIMKKKALGVPVRVVFMTDGRSSHTHLMSANEMAVLRHKEGIAACNRLGLSENEVDTLNFPDEQLQRHHNEAVIAVRKILVDHRPQAIFMPYRHDITPDHEATARIVLEAIHAEARHITLYEYPIWLWNHFPWLHFTARPKRQALRYIMTSLHTGFGLGMVFNFRHFVDISEHLEQKYLALSEHRSQMERLVDNPAWATLADVSDGRFLACFFQGVEIFRRSEIGASS